MKKKKTVWLILSCLVVLTMIAVSCASEATPTPTKTTSTPTTMTSTPTAAAKWYDKFGEPQYGGTMVVRVSADNMDAPDPYDWGGQGMPHQETLFYRDWAVDRAEYHFQLEWAAPQYFGGGSAESWEYIDPTTVRVYLRDNVTWPEDPPMNGRNLTAADVEYTYDRNLGQGHGFTEPNPRFAFAYPNIEKVTAVDEYTVDFKLKNNAFFSIYDVFGGGFFGLCLVAPELVDGGYYDSWDTASVVGLGPWILTERVEGTGTTFERDPDYYGYDERYPENQLPYADALKWLVIPDTTTALAALRSGQIDMLVQMNTLSWQQADALKKSNPDIQQSMWPSPGQSIHLRCDREPFTDINVRIALQLALDLETIAQSQYGGLVSGDPEGLVSTRFTGWALPYDEWDPALQQEYVYDPERAIQMLADAGYPNGFDTNIIAASANVNLELLQVLKAMFMDIGVDMEIRMMDFAGKSSFTSAGKHDQMSYWNSSGTTRPPQNDIIQMVTGQGSAYANDPAYDELVAKAQAASTEAEAQQYCVEANQYALEKHWQVSVFGSISPVAWQPWIQGYSGEMIVMALAPWYYARLWIDQDLK